jgi:hypothetical protein
MHAELDEAPVVLLNEPAMHGIGLTDDQGQKDPGGQMTGVPEEQKNEVGQGVHASWRIRWFTPSATKRIPRGDRERNIGLLRPAVIPKPSAKEAEPLPATVLTSAVDKIMERIR